MASRSAVVGALALLALAFPAGAGATTDTLSTIPTGFSAVEGEPFSSAVGKFLDADGDPASAFTVTIAWGDGTTSAGTPANDVNGLWDVTGSHTYAEEGAYSVTITVDDTVSSLVKSVTEGVTVTDAPLTVPVGAPAAFSGANGSAAGAMAAFTSAVGGADNGTTPGDQANGYRHVTWDTVAADGSAPGSVVIGPGHAVVVTPGAVEQYGIELSRPVAVSNDGFASLNPSAAGLFSPFSSPNVMAPFNSPSVRFQVVSPTGPGGAPSSQATRGLGAIFLNVTEPGSGLDFYNGTTLIGQASAPPAATGQPSFAGLLFPSPVVTSVTLDLGTAPIFDFDVAGPIAGPPNAPPSGANLVALDDVLLAEPASAGSSATATAGVPFSGSVDAFSDQDPAGTAADYTAAIDWGDGSSSSGAIAPSGGAFAVTGSHAFSRAGSFIVTTTVTEIGGSTQTGRLAVTVQPRTTRTSIGCSPAAVIVDLRSTCTLTATDVTGGSPTPPTGAVSVSTSTNGLGFGAGQCQLAPGRGRSATCMVALDASEFPPRHGEIVARYAGDQAHASSHASLRIRLRPPGCVVTLGTTRLRRHARAIPLTIVCAGHWVVRLTGTATAGRTRHARALRLALARTRLTVAAGVPRTILLTPRAATLARLRALARAHRRLSLTISVDATPKAARSRTTVTAPIRVL